MFLFFFSHFVTMHTYNYITFYSKRIKLKKKLTLAKEVSRLDGNVVSTNKVVNYL